MPSEPSTATETPARRPLILRGLALAAALAAVAAQQRPDGRLRLIFPALGGDALIIQSPTGRHTLVDGGSDPAGLAVVLGRALPFWQRDLRLVLLTSADSRRMPGQIAALQRYRAQQLIAAPAVASARGAVFREWQRLVGLQRIALRAARVGQRIDLGGAALRILAADDRGVVLRVEYGATAALLAHASDPQQEQALLDTRRLRPVDLLTFPWERDPRIAFVEALRPRWIHFTTGFHTDRPVELTYRDRAVGMARLSHTANDGAVTWVSDGRRSWLDRAGPAAD
jgi:hypothetical protein